MLRGKCVVKLCTALLLFEKKEVPPCGAMWFYIWYHITEVLTVTVLYIGKCQNKTKKSKVKYLVHNSTYVRV